MTGKDGGQLQPSVSPTKPPGILVTPGTATTRRKTVSFGTEVVDREEKNPEKAEKNSGVPDDYHGKALTSWAPKLEPSTKPTRKTTLTRSLERAREHKDAKSGLAQKCGTESAPLVDLDDDADTEGPTTKKLGARRTNKAQTSNQDLLLELIVKDDFDLDVTMDLNEPHSQSGKYWKSEYEQYHAQARAEMKKLMNYKQLAKSYAKMKDAQALGLAEKLKKEQQRVSSMEDKISKLSAQIATCGSDGIDDDTPELIRELARQTALALQYKGEVEEFRAALEGVNGQGDRNEKRAASPKTVQTPLDTHRELRKLREQLKETDSLRDEVQNLRNMVSAAEKTSSKLREENNKLSQDLLHADLRLEQHLEKFEKRYQSMKELGQKKDDAHQHLQRDYDSLKKLAKSQRHDAEHLLKQRHEQVVGLKKELAAIHGAESTAQDLQEALQKKIAEHDRVVADFEGQISQIRNGAVPVFDDSKDSKDVRHSQKRNKEEISGSHPLGKVLPYGEVFQPDSGIPVSSRSITRPSKIVAPSRSAHMEMPTNSPPLRSSHSALSEIINNATPGTVLLQRSGPVTFTPLANRFSSMSLESPRMKLPSPEPSISYIAGRTGQEKICQASPQPSMFNIPSSPPKPAGVWSRSSDKQRSNNGIAGRRTENVASSRLSSMEGSRTRQTLPPERAAAAKARLEQKNAEKKRAQALGVEKENIRNEV